MSYAIDVAEIQRRNYIHALIKVKLIWMMSNAIVALVAKSNVM